MSGSARSFDDETICPECRGRGMVRPPGEWANETCPTCDGRGRVPAAVAASWTPAEG